MRSPPRSADRHRPSGQEPPTARLIRGGPVQVRFADRRAGADRARPRPRRGRGLYGRPAGARSRATSTICRPLIPATAGGKAGAAGKSLHPQALQAERRSTGSNWQSGARGSNVAHHYDLGDRLYDLFLDADLQYSCAYFTDPGNSLEQAQLDKKAHIAAKLCLKPGQSVLDIGCGWGGMALYLARDAGVEVLGVTLSEEQIAIASERAAEAGVADKVKFELIDYRDVEGKFDRIVSVGMFEHVGPPHYRTFFRKCRDLLSRRRRDAAPHDRPDGPAGHDRRLHAEIHLPRRL